MTEPTVPAQRAAPTLWPTRDAATHVAAVRGISYESARRWLSRHVAPLDREPGREGQNRYVVATVRRLAIIEP